jgi:PAS domain-containing protein
LEFWEPLIFSARGPETRIFRAYRFVFHANKRRFLGDISFDWGQILPGYPQSPREDLLARLRHSVVNASVQALFPEFLESCPVAIAIKDREARLVWGNREYEHLARKARSSLAGLTAQEIFGLTDDHAIVQNEYLVLHANVWLYAAEQLPDRNPRTSLRFRITDAAGAVNFIGTVSAEFRQEDIRHHKIVRGRKRSARQGDVSRADTATSHGIAPHRD